MQLDLKHKIIFFYCVNDISKRILTKKVWQDAALYFIRVTPIPRLLYRTEILTINLKIKTDIKHVKSNFKGYRQPSNDLERNDYIKREFRTL